MPIKKMIFFGFLLASFLVPLHSGAGSLKTVDLNQLTFQSLESGSVELKKEFKGKVLLLDFWASWCGPCKDSLPFYEKLQKRWAAHGLEVIAVSVDENLVEARDFVSKEKIQLRVLWDPDKAVARKLGIQAIPTTFIIKSNGQVFHSERGFFEASKPNLEKKLQEIFKRSP